MNRHFLINAFPPTPESCRRALSARPEADYMKKRRLKLCVVAAMCLVLLGGIAYAADSYGVFRYLLGNAQPSDELTALSQTLGQSAAEDEIQITLTDLVYDGNSLSLSYNVENLQSAQAALIRPESLTLDGQSVTVACGDDSEEALMVPSLHRDVAPVQRNPMQSGLTAVNLPELSGQVTGEITFSVLRPKAGFAIVSDELCDDADLSDYDEEQLPDIQDQRAAALALENAVIIHESEAENYADRARIEPGYGLLSDADETLTETARITIRFTLDASQKAGKDLRPASDTKLSDCAVHIESLWVSPLSTEATVYLLPSENTEEAAQRLADYYGDMTLTDGSGQELTYAEMDYLSGNQPDVVCIDGQWICRYMISMPGVETMPDCVALQAQVGIIWTSK